MKEKKGQVQLFGFAFQSLENIVVFFLLLFFSSLKMGSQLKIKISNMNKTSKEFWGLTH